MTELQSGIGLAGGPRNPLGARALYLWQGNKDTLYRIHGTVEPWTIGQQRVVGLHPHDQPGRDRPVPARTGQREGGGAGIARLTGDYPPPSSEHLAHQRNDLAPVERDRCASSSRATAGPRCIWKRRAPRDGKLLPRIRVGLKSACALEICHCISHGAGLDWAYERREEAMKNGSEQAKGPTPAPVLGLHHFAYRCRDAEETRHFYEDILGLPLVHVVKEAFVPSTGEKTPFAHVFFELKDGSCIAFFDLGDNVKPEPSPNTPPWVNHLALKVPSVKDVETMKARLEANGISVSASPTMVSSSRSTSSIRTASGSSSPPRPRRTDELKEYARTAHAALAAWNKEKAGTRDREGLTARAPMSGARACAPIAHDRHCRVGPRSGRDQLRRGEADGGDLRLRRKPGPDRARRPAAGAARPPVRHRLSCSCIRRRRCICCRCRRALADAGLHVLCAGSRYAKNDSALIMEKVVYDLGMYVRHAREHARLSQGRAGRLVGRRLAVAVLSGAGRAADHHAHAGGRSVRSHAGRPLSRRTASSSSRRI